MGWEYSCSSIPAAYLVGYLAGKRAIKEGVEYAVLDIGMQKVQHGGVLFATVAGMTDAGLEIPHSDEVLPDEDRLKGKHIDDSIEAAIDSIKQKMEAD
jgi:large subunit ribosomal protein L18